jgi:hypothetical protein
MQFDTEAAREAYSELPTDELVRIAYLEDHYVPEAKKLAEDELARRKFATDRKTLDQVRVRLKRQRADSMETDMSALEAESDMPTWRRVARHRLAPYRTPLTIVLLVGCVFVKLDSIREWGVLGLDGRKSDGVAILLLLIGFVFFSPSRDEVERQQDEE